MHYLPLSIILWSCIPLLAISQATKYADRLTDLTCAAPPSEKVRDHDGTNAKQAAKSFCETLTQAFNYDIEGGMSRNRIMHGSDVYNGNKAKDNVYALKIDSYGECAKAGYELKEPVQGIECQDVLYDAWKQCKYGCTLTREVAD